ncbi:MAG: YXWGXW repeat-containing protein [Verrucomicrobia bacterium]|nr:YXWGXW repeat-containing protein [Verrucomicrobiota bacterium]
MKSRILALLALALAALPFSSSQAFVGISVNFAPPILPVVAQPICPAPGYIWTPGYWAYDPAFGYYWVPGAWVPAPSIGLLWTPPYWGFSNGVYVFNQGYWGPTVGFYGGINYGYGYTGNGYWGGRWDGNVFRYNTAVSRVNTTVIHNTYVDQSVVRQQANTSRASFNGPNGITAQPTAQQRAAAESAQKVGPTSQQLALRRAASTNRDLRAAVNHGRPQAQAIEAVRSSAAPMNAPAKTEGERATAAERQNNAATRRNNAEAATNRPRQSPEARQSTTRAENQRAAQNQRAAEQQRAAERQRENARNSELRAARGAEARRSAPNGPLRREMAPQFRGPQNARPRPQPNTNRRQAPAEQQRGKKRQPPGQG